MIRHAYLCYVQRLLLLGLKLELEHNFSVVFTDTRGLGVRRHTTYVTEPNLVLETTARVRQTLTAYAAAVSKVGRNNSYYPTSV